MDGARHTVDAATVRSALRGLPRDDVFEHRVDVDGVRRPPKRLFPWRPASTASPFTSHTALRQLRRLTTGVLGTPAEGGPARRTRQDGDVTGRPTSVAAAASSES